MYIYNNISMTHTECIVMFPLQQRLSTMLHYTYTILLCLFFKIDCTIEPTTS